MDRTMNGASQGTMPNEPGAGNKKEKDKINTWVGRNQEILHKPLSLCKRKDYQQQYNCAQ